MNDKKILMVMTASKMVLSFRTDLIKKFQSFKFSRKEKKTNLTTYHCIISSFS